MTTYFGTRPLMVTDIGQSISTGGSTFALDQLSVRPAAAYSHRWLTSGYTGPLVNVLNFTSGVSQDFFAVNGVLDWTGIISFGSNSSFIFFNTWYDQTGNGFNAIQPTQAFKPRFKDNGTIEIDPSNGLFCPLYPAGRTSGYTILTNPLLGATAASANHVSTGLSGVILSGVPISEWSAPIQSTQFPSAAGNQILDTFATTAATGFIMGATFNFAKCRTYTVRSAAGSWHNWYNGVTLASQTTNTVSPAKGCIGGLVYGGAFMGFLQEVILWNSAVSDADRMTLTANQTAYYSITP